MENFKKWFTSKTVIAGALGVVITGLQLVGVDQAVGLDKDGIASNIVNIAEGVLYLVAIVGRFTAKTKLVA